MGKKTVRANRTTAAGRPIKVLGWATSIGLALLILAMKSTIGLSVDAHRSLALLAGILVVWIFELAPLKVNAGLILAGLVIIRPVASVEQIYRAFSSPTMFFLLGVIGLGQAVMHTGLAQRIADQIVRAGKGNPRKMYWHLIGLLPFLPLLLPSALTRNAVLIPIYKRIFGEGEPVESTMKTRTAVFLALGILNPMASSMYLTGGLMPVTAAALIDVDAGWSSWFLCMGLPYLFLIGVGGVIIASRMGLTTSMSSGTPDQPVESDPESRFTQAERRTCWIAAMTLILWLTDNWHGMPPVVPAIGALALLLLPGMKILNGRKFVREFPWITLLTLGAVLSLANTLTSTGATQWFAEQMVGLIGEDTLSPILFYTFVAALSVLGHVIIPNLIANLSLMVPLVMGLAKELGMDPTAAGLLAMLATDSVILYPVQTTTNIMVYQEGYVRARDVTVLGLGIALVLMVAIPAFILPYWRWIGLLPSS